ncbi:MAG: hypothetical protein K8T90_11885 [Planctomycetes bacterium]|nr:hypothetical protein [Planctomycetota bacterium]
MLPLAVAFALRCGAGFLVAPTDQGLRGFDFYGYMADNLVGGRGLRWAFYEGLGWKYANRAPLYPLLVAAVRWVFGTPARTVLIVAQSLVGSGAVACTALLAFRWGGRRAALVALWIGALWPYSILADTGLVEHVVYAPLCILAAWAAASASDPAPLGDRRALRAGLLFGVATLARLTFAVTTPLLAFCVLRRQGLRAALVASAAMALVLAPWVARNHEAVGHWTLGTDSGRALWVGNSAITYEKYPAESIDEGERELFRRMDPALAAEIRGLASEEVAQDARFREIAVAAIVADPLGSLVRAGRRMCALWSVVYNPGPTSAAKLAIYAASFCALLLAACAGIAVQPRMRADLPVILSFAASFTLVAAVFWGQPRYLAPLHGLGVAAGAAWVARRPGRSGSVAP